MAGYNRENPGVLKVLKKVDMDGSSSNNVNDNDDEDVSDNKKM